MDMDITRDILAPAPAPAMREYQVLTPPPQPDEDAANINAEAHVTFRPQFVPIRTGPEVKKPLTAWVLFLAEHRDQVRLDNPNLSPAEQQKYLSHVWQNLTEDQKRSYTERAKADNVRYKSELAEMGQAQASTPTSRPEQAHSTSPTPAELVCPIGRVRRIIKLDPDVQSITKEATATIGKAMELFVEYLAKETWKVCQQQSNRRALKVQDILECMHSKNEFVWIKDDFPLQPVP